MLAFAAIKSKNAFIEKWLERSVQATFGAFRFLLGGSTHVQLPLARKRNLSHFLEL